MRRRRLAFIFSLVFILSFYLSATDANAQTTGKKSGKAFVDINGDGICDNFQAGYGFDDDGDGIPNGQDPDYVKLKDGSGKKFMQGNLVKNKFGNGSYGPGDGTGNSGLGPRDGTGYGPGSGTGTCDGTGPKGKRSRNSNN
jgi:hypothetical protein